MVKMINSENISRFVSRLSSRAAQCRLTLVWVIPALLAAAPQSASAQFVLTMASGVYQHVNGKVKVVVGSKNGGRGLFVMSANEPINPQEFNLESTSKEGIKHVFLRFDEDAQPPVFSEIWIGSKSYKVNGNLTLNLGENTVIGVDNNNPYLSIVSEEPGGKSAILGFAGLNEVVRATGSAAAILAANQLDTNLAQMMQPYTVDVGQLLFKGKPVSTPIIGTFVKPDNDCLNPTATVLTNAQLTKVQSAKGEEQRMKTLEQIMKTNNKLSPLKGQLVLRSDPKSVVLLDIREKNVREMHPVKSSGSKRKLCVISDLALE